MTTSTTTPSTRPRSDSRKLTEVARHVLIPTGIVSTGWPAVERRCREFGIEFDEWQRGAGKVILGRRADGIYAATVGGITLSIPRQVAKTFLVSRMLFALCTIYPGLQVVWTAHRTRTSTHTFRHLETLAKSKAAAKYMRVDRSNGVRTTNGEQELHFANESMIAFGAREQGFGRGFDAIDVVVFDEAQILTEKALEDMVAPTNQSQHEHGALLFYMGTPPRPIDPGEAFIGKRAESLEALAAIGRGEDVEVDNVFIECSADRNANPDDRLQWKKGNPSYPLRTPERSMLRLRKNLLSDEAWKREGLGIWDDVAVGSRVLTPEQWEARGVDAAPTAGAKALGIAFSFDGSRVAVAGAIRADEKVHVELVGSHSGQLEAGVSSLVDWLCDDPALPNRWRTFSKIVLSGKSGAGVLYEALRKRGVRRSALQVATTVEYTTANATLLDAVRDRWLTYLRSDGQAALTASVTTSTKKQRGADGAWSWQAPEGGDETPAEAASLAVRAARTAKVRTGTAVY